jgi:anti-sigma factor RsiW
MNHEFEDRIEEYVEGALAPDLAREMEAHLEACERCRGAVDTLRTILDEAPRLPRSIAPRRDLWPVISGRLDGEPLELEAEPTYRSPVRRVYGFRSRAAPLAAAAVVLIAIGVSWWVLRQSGGTAAPGNPLIVTASTSLVEEFETAESAYIEAAETLEASYQLERTRLAPQTADAIDRNLDIIDTAIDEVRATVAANPRDPEALDLLAATYRNKVEALKRLTRISARDPDAPRRGPASRPDTDSRSPRR